MLHQPCIFTHRSFPHQGRFPRGLHTSAVGGGQCGQGPFNDRTFSNCSVLKRDTFTFCYCWTCHNRNVPNCSAQCSPRHFRVSSSFKGECWKYVKHVKSGQLYSHIIRTSYNVSKHYCSCPKSAFRLVDYGAAILKTGAMETTIAKRPAMLTQRSSMEKPPPKFAPSTQQGTDARGDNKRAQRGIGMAASRRCSVAAHSTAPRGQPSAEQGSSVASF